MSPLSRCNEGKIRAGDPILRSSRFVDQCLREYVDLGCLLGYSGPWRYLLAEGARYAICHVKPDAVNAPSFFLGLAVSRGRHIAVDRLFARVFTHENNQSDFASALEDLRNWLVWLTSTSLEQALQEANDAVTHLLQSAPLSVGRAVLRQVGLESALSARTASAGDGTATSAFLEIFAETATVRAHDFELFAKLRSSCHFNHKIRRGVRAAIHALTCLGDKRDENYIERLYALTLAKQREQPVTARGRPYQECREAFRRLIDECSPADRGEISAQCTLLLQRTTTSSSEQRERANSLPSQPIAQEICRRLSAIGRSVEAWSVRDVSNKYEKSPRTTEFFSATGSISLAAG